MSQTASLTVKVDIAGFYFAKTVPNVPFGSTILDVMSLIAEEGRDGPVPTDNGVRAQLRFSSNHPKRFLDTIDIAFADPPESRQKNQPGSYLKPVVGRYAATDFNGAEVAIAAGSAILAWQYYVNTATFEGGVIKSVGAPLNGSGANPDGTRIIEPFGGYKLERDALVTWRLITIATTGLVEPEPTLATELVA